MRSGAGAISGVGLPMNPVWLLGRGDKNTPCSQRSETSSALRHERLGKERGDMDRMSLHLLKTLAPAQQRKSSREQ